MSSVRNDLATHEKGMLNTLNIMLKTDTEISSDANSKDLQARQIAFTSELAFIVSVKTLIHRKNVKMKRTISVKSIN